MAQLGWNNLTEEDKATLLRGIADGVAYGGPYHVEIHPADRCNIDCFFCSTAAIRGTDELPLPRFESLLGELKQAGTRSIRLSGGGEPLFHRQIKRVLELIRDSGIPIENLTTNAVLVDDRTAALLVDTCQQITVSLNTVGAESYAATMQTPARNYDRVLRSIRTIVAEKRRRRMATPVINLQFLVWKENWRSIPEMYELTRELGADTVHFNGLSFLPPEKMMSPDEIDGMFALYEQIVRRDEFRMINAIDSFEQDVTGRFAALRDRLAQERAARSPFARLWSLATRRDFTLRQKLSHHAKMKKLRESSAAVEGLEEYCIIGWYSMLIRSNGAVGPCCILQKNALFNIAEAPVRDAWHSPAYQELRSELAEIMREGANWSFDAAPRKQIEPMCGTLWPCPIRTSYFKGDVGFMQELNATLGELRG